MHLLSSRVWEWNGALTPEDRGPGPLKGSHLLAFLPSVWGLLSFSASLSSSVGLWGSERGNAVFKVSTIALTTICRVGGTGSVWLCTFLTGSEGEQSSYLSVLYTKGWRMQPSTEPLRKLDKSQGQEFFSLCLEQSFLQSKTNNTTDKKTKAKQGEIKTQASSSHKRTLLVNIFLFTLKGDS